MLELFGSAYVVDHCIAELLCYNEELQYKSYIADVTKAIAESLGVKVSERFADLIEPKQKEEMTGDEVALQVIKRAGLKVK